MNLFSSGSDNSDVKRPQSTRTDSKTDLQDELNKQLVDQKFQQMFNPNSSSTNYDATTNDDSQNNPNYIINDYESQHNSSSRDSMPSANDDDDVRSDDGIAEELDTMLQAPDRGRRYEFATFHRQYWNWWTFKRMQRYRMTIFILQTPMVIIPAMMNGPVMMFEYATQWAIELCLLTHLLGYIAARRPNSYRWRATTCVVQQLAICFNYTTCFVFWAVVAPIFLPMAAWWYQIGLILGHVTPLMFVLMHYYLNDNIMYPSDWWHTAVAGFIYCWLNWLFTVTGDELVYTFLPWDSFMSVFWCVFCMFVGIIFYWITIMITNKKRNRPYCAGRNDYRINTIREENNSNNTEDLVQADVQENQASSYEDINDL